MLSKHAPMATSKIILDKKLLKTLKPLQDLSYDKLDELVNKSSLEDLPAGRVLFKQGERDKRTLFLLAGQVTLSSIGDPRGKTIRARSKEAAEPLAEGLPRSHTCRTKTEATILSIDSDLLEILLDDNPSGLYEVDELGSGDDSSFWMMRFLQSRAFLNLPTENIQALLMALEEVPVEKGQTILRQGDKDDYYYIVQKGKCAVSRRPAPRAAEMQLAILTEGDGFGEEALITNGVRNASVTMLEDGILMRLKKEDFMRYLAEPLIQYTDEKDVLAEISKGSLLIDVRSNEEYQAARVEGSVNIPLSMLRLKLEGMNTSRNYILCCNDGTRSAAAAFLLTQHGLTCHVLRGGLEKANIKLPDANLSVPVAPPVENSKTQAAERNFRAAEEKTEKLKQQAEQARSEAQEIARRMEEAEAAQRKAAAEVERQQKEELNQRDAAIRSAKMRAEKEAQRARAAEEKAAKLKLEARAVRQKADEELQRIRAEAEAVKKRQQALDEALKRAEQITAEADRAAREARQQAEKEAARIREEAEQEAKRLREEMEATMQKVLAETEAARKKEEAERQAAMATLRLKEKEAEEIRRQAELEARKMREEMQSEHSKLLEQAERERREKEAERQAAIEQARKKAREAEEIRRQAELEAQKMRSSLSEQEASLREAQELTAREREQLLEQAQREAQQVIEETSRKAEEEAEAIRRRAEEEAEQLQRELEEARRQLESSRNNIAETERLQRESLLEESRKQAEELIRQSAASAEAEAEAIRQQARREAEQLRAELARAREQIESSVSQARDIGSQQHETIVSEAQQQARQMLLEAQRKAQQEAEQIRIAAELEAKRVREELEQARLQLAEQANNIKKVQAINARIEKEKQQKERLRRKQQIAARERQKQAQARKMAEQIKARLEQAEKQRQSEESSLGSGDGISLAEVSVKRVKDRIILEGSHDIFVFKEPPPLTEEDRIPELHSAVNRDEDELPSFTVDEQNQQPAATPFNNQEFERAMRERDQVLSQARKNKRRGLFTVAASLLLTIAAAGAFLIYRPGMQQDLLLTENAPATGVKAQASLNPVRELKQAVEMPSKLAIAREESRLRQQAEDTFNELVGKWKDLFANTNIDVQAAPEVASGAEQAPAPETEAVPAEAIPRLPEPANLTEEAQPPALTPPETEAAEE
ncbi:MAG TPA: cyclic nucleotide-binding domain-containing protein [Gammaproteobacteria bacterium]|nr:cyclic nucleotide-binding domain-containing protein [Gammaproteobacteria bacterium]